MAELTYVRCGKLFDGTNETLHEGWNILIEGGMIKEVGPAVACPNGAKVIDLSHLTVTPGLIDAHIHIDFDGKDDSAENACLCTENPAGRLYHPARHRLQSLGLRIR